MFKIIGAVSVFASCVIVGFLKSYRLKRRSESLFLFAQAIERLGVEISFTKKRLERIFAEISREFALPIFYDSAISIKTMGLKRSWEEALNKYAHDLALSDSDINTLSAVGDISGYAGEEQQRCIHTLVKLLELSHSEALDIYSRTGKLCRSIGLLLGLLLVILLF